ncbi:zinc finger protein weckle-like [Sabethes cyaneus]|uniref:zinc finger protein weckle-like n=1 Tax=Sabethes cyaneus TaxID=53552 RepID=UPI00237DD4B1|nr:zinc finger protein weckle-like [Sabethes cyaneus]
MLGNWKSWCRLCANECTVFTLESLDELNEILLRHFNFALQEIADICNSICEECYNFVNKLDRFKERCSQTSKLLTELCAANDEDLRDGDIQDLRFRFLSDSIVVVPDDETDDKDGIQTDTSEPNLETSKLLEQGLHTSDLGVQGLIGLEIVQTASSEMKSQSLESLDIKTEFAVCPLDEDDQIEEHDSETAAQNDDEETVLDVVISEDSCNSDEEIKPKESKKENKRKVKSKRIEIVRQDLEDNTEIGIQCESCEKTFRTRSLYVYHLQSKHPDSRELAFSCSLCPKRFPSEKKAKLHEYVHLPKDKKVLHPCDFCDKKFSQLVNVQAHIKAVHIGERPYICEECGKALGTKGALKEHQITHSDEKPFQCSYCPKKFKNLPRLKTHEDIHNDTLYVCPHCGLQLNTKRTLKMHMVVHSDQKRFKCQYCGNEYKRSKALKSHLILHTGLRPYQCPFCEKTFANGSNCRTHKKKAHPKELAALEASGGQTPATNIPKLRQLQPKTPEDQASVAADATRQASTIVASNPVRVVAEQQSPTASESLSTEDLLLTRNVRLVTAYFHSHSEPPPLNILANNVKGGTQKAEKVVPKRVNSKSVIGQPQLAGSDVVTIPPLQLISSNL